MVRLTLIGTESTMTKSEQRLHDCKLLLEVLKHRTEGSLHPQADLLNVAYALGLSKQYGLELISYLRVNGYIEHDRTTYQARLTDSGSRMVKRRDLAA